MDDLKSEVPELHQHAPISGEQYVFPDDAYRRLQNYALVTGFAIRPVHAVLLPVLLRPFACPFGRPFEKDSQKDTKVHWVVNTRFQPAVLSLGQNQ